MIIYTIIQILLTLAGAGAIGYSIYLTIQVSGDKLLTLDSELGYRYATSYHRWQLYAGIAIVSLLILWIVYILIVRAYRVKHREERLAKKAEKKNEKKIAREQKKQQKKTASENQWLSNEENVQPVNAQNMQQPYTQGYYPNAQNYYPDGYVGNAQSYYPNGYETNEQGYYPSGYEANTQGYYPNGYEANGQDYYSNGYNADEQGYASNSYDVNTKIYDQKANSQDISSDKADSQEMKQEWNGKEL